MGRHRLRADRLVAEANERARVRDAIIKLRQEAAEFHGNHLINQRNASTLNINNTHPATTEDTQ